MVVFKELVNQSAWLLALSLFRVNYVDIDSLLIFLLFPLYLLQEGVVLR
jgi:hypothetical protein